MIVVTTMILSRFKFTTLLALVTGGIGVIKPVAAGVLAGLRVDLGIDAFQRRQTTGGNVPTQCEYVCDPINAMLAAVSEIICSSDKLTL